MEMELLDEAAPRHIFISYRHEDTCKGTAGRIYDRLTAHFGDGAVFMDVDSLNIGFDFAQAIEDAVDSCDVLLAVMGTGWLSATDELGRRRLDDPDDFIVLEVKAGLDRKIPVIPVLVDGAAPPRRSDLPEQLAPLARRHGLRLENDNFSPGMTRLITSLEQMLAVRLPRETPAPADSDDGLDPPVTHDRLPSTKSARRGEVEQTESSFEQLPTTGSLGTGGWPWPWPSKDAEHRNLPSTMTQSRHPIQRFCAAALMVAGALALLYGVTQPQFSYSYHLIKGASEVYYGASFLEFSRYAPAWIIATLAIGCAASFAMRKQTSLALGCIVSVVLLTWTYIYRTYIHVLKVGDSYDSTGHLDLASFRLGSGFWCMLAASLLLTAAVPFGISTDSRIVELVPSRGIRALIGAISAVAGACGLAFFPGDYWRFDALSGITEADAPIYATIMITPILIALLAPPIFRSLAAYRRLTVAVWATLGPMYLASHVFYLIEMPDGYDAHPFEGLICIVCILAVLGGTAVVLFRGQALEVSGETT